MAKKKTPNQRSEELRYKIQRLNIGLTKRKDSIIKPHRVYIAAYRPLKPHGVQDPKISIPNL